MSTGHARLAGAMDVRVSASARTAASRSPSAAGTSPPRSAPRPPGQGASRVAAWPDGAYGPAGAPARLRQPPGTGGRRPGYGHRGLPRADLKIFLTASAEERALRRYKQLKDKGSDVSLPALSREIAERDLRDSTRAVAPLKPAPDAEVIDSTGLTIEQVVERVLALGRARACGLLAARARCARMSFEVGTRRMRVPLL